MFITINRNSGRELVVIIFDRSKYLADFQFPEMNSIIFQSNFCYSAQDFFSQCFLLSTPHLSALDDPEILAKHLTEKSKSFDENEQLSKRNMVRCMNTFLKFLI